MNGLLAKLSLALLGIIVGLGLVFFLIERNSSQLYYQELTQRLNGPIAMYVVGERELITDGVVDTDTLQDLAHQAMVINPSVEVYLLDKNGGLLAHALPEESVRMRSIDLGPVREMLDGPTGLPLKGDDPRNPGLKKVFSAAAVMNGDELQGYLYAILGGQKYDELARDIGSSRVGRLTVIAISLLVFAAFVIGLLVFALLTRRLRSLTGTVQAFADNDFSGTNALSSDFDGDDEIDRLARVFARMSHRIAEQMDRLQENDKLRRELVANVSHDLRTPLASMQGYIETLLIKEDSLSQEDRKEYLGVARKHAKRLNDLIGDLFELSRLDANSVKPVFEWFSLAELLQDVVQEFRLQAERKNLQLEFAVPGDMSPVFADIGLIQRVLENLVRNAMRFTPAGGTVRINVEGRPDAVAVAVEDTGSGIDEADIPKIFDRFYGDGGTSELYSDSSGLGLAIVKRILDLHHTRITVVSRADQGTRFEFELPIDRRAA